jgi:hypothetical protein
MEFMIEQLIPEDNARDDTDHHTSVRRLTEQPIETTDDRVHTGRIQSDHRRVQPQKSTRAGWNYK